MAGGKKKKTSMSAAVGAPMWMATFADLMALLMTFFVMLLALSEVDKAKFETLGISMKMALGTEVAVTAPQSADEIKPLQDPEIDMEVQTMQDAAKIADVLDDYMEMDEIEVETKGRMIIVRMLDSGVFESGSSTIKTDFKPVLAALKDAVKDMPGEIVVSGHTDDVPIANADHRSNWELSAGRAYSVIQQLVSQGDIPKERFVLQGFGETRPLFANDTVGHRAKNRRVELIIDQREPDEEVTGLRGQPLVTLPTALPTS